MSEEDVIPCELCNTLVEASRYYDHIMSCQISIPISFYEDDDTADEDDDDENVIANYITRSNQVPRGELRRFLNEHFNGSNGSQPLYFQMAAIRRTAIEGFLNEVVEVGLTKEQLEKVSTICEPPKEGMCPICQEFFKDVTCKTRMLACKHPFCDECISKWLSKHKKCPLCLVDLEDAYCL